MGPSELTTLILQPEPEIFKPKPNTNPENSFLKHIVELLLNYLSDGNISVMEASNKSLIKIMATQERCSLYGNENKIRNKDSCFVHQVFFC